MPQGEETGFTPETSGENKDLEELEQHEAANVASALFDEVLKEKIVEYITAVRDGKTDSLDLRVDASTVNLFAEKQLQGELPDHTGGNQAEYVEELEDQLGLES